MSQPFTCGNNKAYLQIKPYIEDNDIHVSYN